MKRAVKVKTGVRKGKTVKAHTRNVETGKTMRPSGGLAGQARSMSTAGAGAMKGIAATDGKIPMKANMRPSGGLPGQGKVSSNPDTKMAGMKRGTKKNNSGAPTVPAVKMTGMKRGKKL